MATPAAIPSRIKLFGVGFHQRAHAAGDGFVAAAVAQVVRAVLARPVAANRRLPVRLIARCASSTAALPEPMVSEATAA